MDKYQLYAKLQDGYRKLQNDDRAVRVTKEGVWRGGTSGCITEDGRVLGADPRQAVLRFLGIEIEPEFDTNLMFQLGNLNEEGWAELLDAADVQHKREEAIPMTHTFVVDGKEHTITGRPDMVLVDNDIPQSGIELKQICSYHTAMKVANFIDNKPKTDNVIQAAVYSDYFGVPWVLAYTNRVNWPTSYGNPTRNNPKGRWSVPDHRALRKDENGRVYTLLPFISMYDITWDGDKMLLDDEPTLITASGIRRWYEYCAKCVDTQTVPKKRSGSWTFDGDSVDDDKNDVLRYDDYASARTDTWENWVDDCRKIAERLNWLGTFSIHKD